ncbi:glycosyl hydrolase [Nesterenkonia alba]|uniref:glycosyl hydrolase n=1 Tax=Nesterenkonia alba TaxID=515814 RepID=UPI0003B404A3|nr:glycosyl hydrolase [Nesterenkonia alba]
MANSTVHSADAPLSLETLRTGFATPDKGARPMMRWWWFGPDVDRADLVRDLDDMVAAGIGGVEVAFVYPLGETSAAFLSEEHLATLGYAAEAAEARGMRFDITLGSGWPYGGPHIDAETGSRKIAWLYEEVPLAAHRLAPGPLWDGDTMIAAYIGDGTTHETPEHFEPLEVTGAEILIPEGRGPRAVLIAVSRLTRQSLKRAAHGAEGLALDHYSAVATRRHIEAVAEPLVAAAGAHRIGTVFCDSLEVYEADWTPQLPEEFRTRRGYDVVPHLWKLRHDSLDAHQSPDSATVRADYYRTLTELLDEQFIKTMGDWARSKGLRFRIQAYGEPPASVSSYRHADGFEGEHWGWNLVTACRWASSAAEIYGTPVVSSECWTWTHSPSFRSTPLDLLGEAQEHFLAGINQLIGHGWPASPRPENPREIGRIFYASGALDSRNAWWDAAGVLWGTLHRLSWLLRQGRRAVDVGLYIPAQDIYATRFRAEGRIDLYRETRLYIGQELPSVLRTAGLDYTLIDDDAVTTVDPDRYPVIVLPWTSRLPETTRAWLQQVHSRGGTVLDLGGSAGIGTPVHDVSEVVRFTPARLRLQGIGGSNQAVAATSRVIGDMQAHLVVNTANAPAEVDVVFPSPRSTVEQWDPETGNVRGVWRHTAEVRLHLEPYESVVLIEHDAERAETEHDDASPPEAHVSSATPGEVWTLDDWQFRFADTAAAQAKTVTLPHLWEQHEDRQGYAGQGIYTREITIPAAAQRVELDFGPGWPTQARQPEPGRFGNSYRAGLRAPVETAAVVEVDGRRVGTLWKPPYRVDLTEAVTPGSRHQLRLLVANVTSLKLAADDSLAGLVERTEAQFGRRFRMQSLSAAADGVASGVHRSPQVTITMTEHS